MEKLLKKSKTKISPLFALLGALLFIYTLTMFSLLYYAVIVSVKEPISGFFDDPIGFPKIWHIENYKTVLVKMSATLYGGVKKVYIEGMFLNSMVYVLGSTVASVVSITLMAYATAVFNKKIISKIIYGIVIFTIIFPIIGNQPSLMQVAIELKLYNKMPGAFFMAFSFWGLYYLVLYEMIKKVPKDYSEAAQIDGASYLTVMFKVILPMCIKTIGAIFLITFIAYWNDYQTPLLFFPSYPTVSYGMWSFYASTAAGITEPIKVAAAIVVLSPILVLFVFFRKQLMGNMSAGGLKG